jgi:DNA-directed RNA polymerase subunit F
MKRLGTYTTGKACLYIRRLSDVDPNVLQELIEESVATLRNMNRDIASRQSTSAAIG